MTKEEWSGINVQYNGPITFLVMLYTHEYQKKYGPFGTPVTTSAVNYITTTTLNKMEKYLENNGPPLEEDATEVAAVTLSVNGKGIDAAAAAPAPAAVTVSAAGKGLDETADAVVADTADVTVSAARKRLDETAAAAAAATAAVTVSAAGKPGVEKNTAAEEKKEHGIKLVIFF
ncbi:uncharacterized protein LOC143569256 [Bidens hawaiensis]|uniref:uncharacterized protein LOC143569256 n=1 Tax=Bidens hawaiensis TaxID=980011 RepID=UPI004049E8B9